MPKKNDSVVSSDWTEDFRTLLMKAIGSRTQKTFAEEAGISPSHLSRMLSLDEATVPTRKTLQKIASASEGRVSLAQLERVCGYPISAPATPQDTSIDFRKRIQNEVQNIKQGLMEFRNKATTYESAEAMFDAVSMLYCTVDVKIELEEPEPFDAEVASRLRRGPTYGAEHYQNATVSWADDDVAVEMGCVLFFCITTKGHFIFSDVAFDLPTLAKTENPVAGKMMIPISERKDAVMSDYQTVYIYRILNPELRKKEDGFKALLRKAGITDGMSVEEQDARIRSLFKALFEDDEESGDSEETENQE